MEKLAKRISKEIGDTLHLDTERQAVIAYGLTAMIQMGAIFAIVSAFGAVCGFLMECWVLFFGVGLIRKSTGGVHSKSIYGCLFVSVGSILCLSYLSVWVTQLPLSLKMGCFISLSLLLFCGILFYIRVPMDSPNKPIVKPQKIKRLRRQSFCLLIGIAMLAFGGLFFKAQVPWLYRFSFSLQLALVWQTFTLTKPCAIFIGAIDHIFCKND